MIDRFWSKVDKSAGPCGCWTWLAGKQIYGVFWFARKNWKAHRFAWVLTNGPVPKGMCVCHRCDNPLCVNPTHLWLGTNPENTADKVSKGRQARGIQTRPETRARGERQWLSRLTARQVLEIRSSAASGAELAHAMGVDQSTVNRARRGDTWRHV